MKLKDLEKEYDKLQEKHRAEELTSIYNGGCSENPDICFIFMNPTGLHEKLGMVLTLPG